MTLTASDLYKPAVEKAAEALVARIAISNQWCRDLAQEAILTYLNACLEAGEAQEAGAAPSGHNWIASSNPESWVCTDGDFNCLILRMERKP